MRTNLFCFMFFSVVLFPVAFTFFITWWFVQFVDGFFSPLYAKLGINIFGNSFYLYFDHAVYGSDELLVVYCVIIN